MVCDRALKDKCEYSYAVVYYEAYLTENSRDFEKCTDTFFGVENYYSHFSFY